MNYSGVYKTSIVDGIGWRVVLFVSGCTHGCKGCHNKETWHRDYGKEFTQETINLLCKELQKPEIDGLTLSGGDPLMPYNREEITNLCKLIKTLFPDKTIWLYTGYTWEKIKKLDVLNYVDVVVDGKFEIDNRDVTLAFRGSSNQRIIDVQKSISSNSICTISI